jgi:hypothetical protein
MRNAKLQNLILKTYVSLHDKAEIVGEKHCIIFATDKKPDGH